MSDQEDLSERNGREVDVEGFVTGWSEAGRFWAGFLRRVAGEMYASGDRDEMARTLRAAAEAGAESAAKKIRALVEGASATRQDADASAEEEPAVSEPAPSED